MTEHQKKDEGIRQLLGLAISCGRNWQSPQTGYIHYCPFKKDEKEHHTIPFYENLLFALALLRSHHVENGLEAMGMLDRLLPFQDASCGNFPTFLHEYPSCKDRTNAVHLLIPFSHILLDFHAVLTKEIKTKLERSIKHLVAFCLKTHQERALPYHLAIKIAAASICLGAHLHIYEWESFGKETIESLRALGPHPSWGSPTSLADILTALQLLYPKIKDSPWHLFWDYLNHTWHAGSLSYCGPGLKEYQEMYEPQVTLFDFFGGYYASAFPFRAFKDHPIQLQAILVKFSEEKFNLDDTAPFEKRVGDSLWRLQQTKDAACAIVEKSQEAPHNLKTFHPLKWLFGNAMFTHSLVFQGGNLQEIHTEGTLDDLQIEIKLGEVNFEEKDKQREVCFFLDSAEEVKWLIDGSLATTFLLNEKVTIQAKEGVFTFVFSLLEGEGEFMGHIMKGNRPSQVALKGENRFCAYDWQIFLRTLKRSSCVRLRVSVAFKKNDA